MTLLTGQNGIITQTISAKELYTKESIRESLNIELTGIITEQIYKGETTSRKSSFNEFGKLNYNVEESTDNTDYTRYLIIVDNKYVYEIEEKLTGDQEVVYWGEENRLYPVIQNVELAIEKSKLKITVNSKHSVKYDANLTYEGDPNNSDDKEVAIANGTKQNTIYFDIKKINKEDLYGEFTINITSYNANDEASEMVSPKINVSKLVFNADTNNDTQGSEIAKFKDGSKQYITYVENGTNLGAVTDSNNGELPALKAIMVSYQL